ncbi:PLP-dependent transferase [Clavulina sp. PMI_390]|nr:PLP-dependent transferase [Clavulina sp. PMI_390]
MIVYVSSDISIEVLKQAVVTHNDGLPIATERLDAPVPSAPAAAFPPEFYEPFFSAHSKTWSAGAIRGVMIHENKPGMLSLLAGKPNSSTFPITSLSMKIKSPVPPFTETTIELEQDKLDEALQYGPLIGQGDLVNQLFDLQLAFHGRKRDPSWRISIGAGGQDVIYKIITTLTDPGDVVLCEAPTWAGILPALRSSMAELVEVPIDSRGIRSSELRRMLENWPKNKKMPKFIYTVPYGCNPSGITAAIERRKELLELARKYQFIILEDDPYYLLYYGEEARPPSYFELEGQDNYGTGIVVRSDSFSKVFSPGLRMGFVSGPTSIVNRIDLFTSQAQLQPSSLSQSVVSAILAKWEIDGFRAHAHTVAQFYDARRKVFEAAMEKHLGGLVEYTSPVAGMFLWFKLLIPPPADDPNATEGDSNELITQVAFKRGVLACPGGSFFAGGRRSAYVRAAFSVLTDEETDEALRRLAEVVREARGELVPKV